MYSNHTIKEYEYNALLWALSYERKLLTESSKIFCVILFTLSYFSIQL